MATGAFSRLLTLYPEGKDIGKAVREFIDQLNNHTTCLFMCYTTYKIVGVSEKIIVVTKRKPEKNIQACRDLSTGAALLTIGHFQVLPGLCFKPRERCSAFDMEFIFRSHASKTHFHKKGCAPSFILKVRVFGTRKWPIELASQLGAGSWSWLLK